MNNDPSPNNVHYTDDQRLIALEVMMGTCKSTDSKPKFKESAEIILADYKDDFPMQAPTKETLSNWWRNADANDKHQIMMRNVNALQFKMLSLITKTVDKAVDSLTNIEANDAHEFNKLMTGLSALIKETKDMNFGQIHAPAKPIEESDIDKVRKNQIQTAAPPANVDVDAIYPSMAKSFDINLDEYRQRPDGLYKRQKDVQGNEVWVLIEDTDEINAYNKEVEESVTPDVVDGDGP